MVAVERAQVQRGAVRVQRRRVGSCAGVVAHGWLPGRAQAVGAGRGRSGTGQRRGAGLEAGARTVIGVVANGVARCRVGGGQGEGGEDMECEAHALFGVVLCIYTEFALIVVCRDSVHFQSLIIIDPKNEKGNL